MSEDTFILFRRLRNVGGPLHLADINQSEIPVPRFKLWRVIIGYFIVCWGLSQAFPLIGWKVSEQTITQLGNLLVLLGTCYPLLVWVIKSAFAGRVLTEHYFRFPKGAQFWYGVVLFQLILIPLHVLAPHIFMRLGWWNFAVLFGGGFVSVFLLALLNARQKIPRGSPSPSNRFGLYLGTSTGILGELSHGAAIKKGQNVFLSLQDAAQNILVLGGIGSGKTTRAVQPLLVQLFDQDSGGLIFDIKGDFKRAVEAIANGAGRPVTVIGPEKTKMNLISGLSPEVASSFLKSALLLNSRGSGDPFWIDTAAELCKNALGVLSFFPKRYSLSDLHEYLFDPAIRSGVNEEA